MSDSAVVISNMFMLAIGGVLGYSLHLILEKRRTTKLVPAQVEAINLEAELTAWQKMVALHDQDRLKQIKRTEQAEAAGGDMAAENAINAEKRVEAEQRAERAEAEMKAQDERVTSWSAEMQKRTNEADAALELAAIRIAALMGHVTVDNVLVDLHKRAESSE